MNDLTIFNNPEFGEVRMVMMNDEPWFVGKDVAEILGYQDTYGALKKHVDDEDRQNCQNDSFESNRGLTIINESGLYSMILSSKLPKAKEFKRWVTAEVLPTIRKTGSYTIRKEDTAVEKGDFLLRCAEMVKTKNWKELLVRGAANMVAGYELLPPLVVPKTYSAGEVGKILGISANKVGRIATQNGLKTDEYGVWCHDIARNGQKEVEIFRYNDDGVEAIRQIIYS